jgi:hypothetical protein
VTEGTVEHKILERANAKRQLEKLVIHKGQFKGSRKYYESKKLINLDELSEILRKEQTIVDSGHVQGKPLQTLADVISEKEMNRILNRDPEPNVCENYDPVDEPSEASDQEEKEVESTPVESKKDYPLAGLVSDE